MTLPSCPVKGNILGFMMKFEIVSCTLDIKTCFITKNSPFITEEFHKIACS